MKRRFFLNNFMKYSCVMMVPMIVIFLSFMYVTQRESISEVERQANYTLEGVNTYFDMVISNIVFQNDQLILNPHSMLALKEALKENPRLSYNEYTHIRKIQNLMNSITNTYDYVDSVALGLKNHSRYISSTNGLQEITEEEATWMEVYENMPEDRDTFVFSRTVGLGDQKKRYSDDTPAYDVFRWRNCYEYRY